MLSVIIVTWNRINHLKTAIPSVLMQQHIEMEILVVDNGSSDGTQAYVESVIKEHPHVRYTRLDTNKGVPEALNVGLQMVQGDVIFVFDDDEELSDPLYFEKALALDARYPWDILTTAVINRDGLEEPFLSNPAPAKTNFYVANFINGSVFVRREVYQQLGLFEACYFRQAQENEYALRAILSGYRILYTREISLWHHQATLNRPEKDIILYYACRNTLLKNYKYYRGWQLAFLNGWQLFQHFMRLLAGKITLRTLYRSPRDYIRMKHHIAPVYAYTNENMERFYFLSRRTVAQPEQIRRMGFWTYAVSGLQRFLR